MHIYTPQTFDIPLLTDISEKQVAVHLKLYEGYVAHTNLIAEKLAAVREGSLALDAYVVAELRRRFAFEFNGMRLHEYYFTQFEGGPTPLKNETPFGTAVTEKYGSIESFYSHIRDVATTRGIGWVLVTYDTEHSTVHTSFVADHEIGSLAGLPVIVALDLWEHAFMVDRVPADKKLYIDAWFANINWDVCANRLPV